MDVAAPPAPARRTRELRVAGKNANGHDGYPRPPSFRQGPPSAIQQRADFTYVNGGSMAVIEGFKDLVRDFSKRR